MKKSLYFAATIAAVISAASLSGRNYSPAEKLYTVAKVVEQYYVDTVNEEKLAEEAIRGMLKELDPHSSYSTPEETRELNEPLQGNFSGIGITFNMNNDTLYVIQTVSGGPSERVGLLAGDRIIAVNDSAIAGVKMKNSDIMKRLRGPKGTNVEVKVLRKERAKTDTIDFRITRDDIPIYSVECSYMVDPKTGYIRLNRFAAETPKEMRDAITKLKKQGMTQLILDLTDNGGGYLNAATELLGELLNPGEMAVYTEGRNSPRAESHALPYGRKPLFADGRLVVMANQYSASASEITSGAIQDWDRGLIVGRRTFGKGLVQRPIPFADGSMVRLTVAHYYTPTGRDIQKPYVKGDKSDYDKDILDRFNHGELMHQDSIKYDETMKMRTLRNGRTIYGGGGISPDLFVPLDTMANTRYYRDIMAKGLLNRYAISYVDNHRNELKKEFKNDDAFNDRFQVTPEMLQQLYDLATAEGIEFNKEQADLSVPLLSMVIKALIGRDIFDNATYFKVYNRFDPIFKEAYRLINSQDYTTILNSGHKPGEESPGI